MPGALVSSANRIVEGAAVELAGTVVIGTRVSSAIGEFESIVACGQAAS